MLLLLFSPGLFFCLFVLPLQELYLGFTDNHIKLFGFISRTSVFKSRTTLKYHLSYIILVKIQIFTAQAKRHSHILQVRMQNASTIIDVQLVSKNLYH